MLKITVRESGPVPGGVNLTQREWNQVKREAWQDVAEYWHEELLPKHFTAAGAKEYDYTPRRGEMSGTSAKRFFRSYTGRKQKQKGHRNPLVWSGELRDRSRTRRIQTFATSSQSGVRIYLSAAQKANWKNPHSDIDMADELTRISSQEYDLLTRMFAEKLEEKLARIQTVTETPV
ncbi:MAG: hypothetical protein ACOY3Y_01650 [Acidobacteriota bacterium]